MDVKRCVLAVFFVFHTGVANGYGPQTKPDPSDARATARWLVSQNLWGVLSTISIDLGGAPFGNVVSFSDGPPGQGSGIPYFYLTKLDPTPRDVLKDSRCSFTISEAPLGTCGDTDPENPTCSKLTLTGKMKQINGIDPEADFAAKALFSKHSEMTDWPKGHNFQYYKLIIEDIYLIDWFGGPKPLSVVEYFQPGWFQSKKPRILYANTCAGNSLIEVFMLPNMDLPQKLKFTYFHALHVSKGVLLQGCK